MTIYTYYIDENLIPKCIEISMHIDNFLLKDDSYTLDDLESATSECDMLLDKLNSAFDATTSSLAEIRNVIADNAEDAQANLDFCEEEAYKDDNILCEYWYNLAGYIIDVKRSQKYLDYKIYMVRKKKLEDKT
tara:strand:- start:57 stop:455 length:399 start_codon:yes stop_codon:yes gene_type:complete